MNLDNYSDIRQFVIDNFALFETESSMYNQSNQKKAFREKKTGYTK